MANADTGAMAPENPAAEKTASILQFRPRPTLAKLRTLARTDPDAALLAAEAEAARLLAVAAGLSDQDADPLLETVWRLRKLIDDTCPIGLAGAAVKLRKVLDADLGLPDTTSESDVPNIRAALCVIERVGGEACRPQGPHLRPISG